MSNGLAMPAGARQTARRVLLLAGLLAGTAAWAAEPATGAASAPAAASRGPAAAARQLPAEVFFAHPQVLQAVLSPSGQYLAVTTARGAPRVSLVVMDLKAGNAMRRIVSFDDADVVGVRWLGDDRIIFEATDLQAGGAAAQREGRGLFVVQTDGNELRNLIARRNPRTSTASPLARRALSWNHVLLSVPRRGEGVAPDEIIVGSWGGGPRLPHLQPMWLDVRTLRTRSADFPTPEGGAIDWIFDARGAARVAIGVNEGRRLIHWRGPGDKDWRLLAEQDALRPPFTPRFVDDQGTLYVTRPQGPQGRAVLARFDFARGAPEDAAWVSVDGFDFDGQLVGGAAGAAAAGVRVEADAETTVWWDPAMGRLQELVDARLPGRINRLTCRHCGSPDAVALVRSWSDREPGELWLLRPTSGQWQRLARLMERIDPAAMASVSLHRIAARDGREIPVWVTSPAGASPTQPLPTVVLAHGGPYVRGGHWSWNAEAQFLASRGWRVLLPEFRGSTGYGESHHRAGWQQWGLAMQDDLADALAWARREGLADANRACIMGASYGGYAALMGLVRHPELYRCGVAAAAVTDLPLLLQGSAWVLDDAGEYARRHTLPDLIGDVHRDAARLAETSPVQQAARIRAPLLLAFGERDFRVPLAHGERLRAALRAQGREPEWIVYPDEAHGWRKPENQVDYARRVEAFLSRHLDGAAP